MPTGKRQKPTVSIAIILYMSTVHWARRQTGTLSITYIQYMPTGGRQTATVSITIIHRVAGAAHF